MHPAAVDSRVVCVCVYKLVCDSVYQLIMRVMKYVGNMKKAQSSSMLVLCPPAAGTLCPPAV